MFEFLPRHTGALLLSTLLSAPAALAADAQQLLQASDAARGASASGLGWDVELINVGKGPDDHYQMRVRTIASASTVEILEPVSSKGAKMLQVNNNLWLGKPGLRKAVPISPRQRLSGLIAIGDVAATNYARDYNATLLRREKIDGEECEVLDLVAKGRNTTYDHIVYWISASRHVGLRAEFYSLSGKLMKSATFEYGNAITGKSGRLPFVSNMTVVDAVSVEESRMRFTNVKPMALSGSDFNVDAL